MNNSPVSEVATMTTVLALADQIAAGVLAAVDAWLMFIGNQLPPTTGNQAPALRLDDKLDAARESLRESANRLALLADGIRNRA